MILLAVASGACVLVAEDADARKDGLSSTCLSLAETMGGLRLSAAEGSREEPVAQVQPGLQHVKRAVIGRQVEAAAKQVLEDLDRSDRLRRLPKADQREMGSERSEFTAATMVFAQKLRRADPEASDSSLRVSADVLMKAVDRLEATARVRLLKEADRLAGTARRSTIFGVLLAFACLGVGAVAIALRFRELFHQAVKDRIKLEGAFEELVSTKTALQQQKTDVEEALEEAKSKTLLFEHASNRFQQLFGGLPLGCLTYDTEGVVQEWNPAMTDLVGLDGYVGCYQPLEFTFRGDGDSASISEIVREVLTNGAEKNFEWAHRTLDGRTVYAFYVTYPLRSLSGAILGGIIAGFNITQRKEAERALVQSKERYQVAVEASATGIFDWNIREGSQHWSPKVFEILGLDRTFVPQSHTITAMVHSHDRAAFEKGLQDHLEGRASPYKSEIRVCRPDGTTVWILVRGEAHFDEAGRAIRFAGSIDDITQRKEAELALAESEARFRDVTEAAGEFVFELNSRGFVTLITPRITEITGRTPEELLGTHFAPLFVGSWRSFRNQGMLDAVRAKRKINEVIVQTMALSGDRRWLRITASPFRDSRGRFLGYRGTGLDITAEIESEDQLAHAHRMLHDTLESIRDCFFSLDQDCAFSYVNSAAAAGLCMDGDALIGSSVWDAVSREMEQQLRPRFEAALIDRTAQAFEVLDHETSLWYQYRVYPREQGISVFYQDITDRKRFESQIEAQMVEINEKNVILQIQQRNLEDANKRLATLATTDGLTGLKNHKAFQSSLAELYEQAQETAEPISLIMLDVDHFKRYNDAYGHPAGDEVLRSVAMILKNLGRRGDVAARYGGEEFVVLLPGATGRDAEKAAERIRQGIADHAWPFAPITASLGVSCWEGGAMGRTELVDRADSAMYQSKREGRNRVTRWRSAVPQRAA